MNVLGDFIEELELACAFHFIQICVMKIFQACSKILCGKSGCLKSSTDSSAGAGSIETAPES